MSCVWITYTRPGQEAVGNNIWHSARDLVNQLNAEIRPPGYITLDMSNSKEAIPVPVRNTVDHDVYPLERAGARSMVLLPCPHTATTAVGGFSCASFTT